MKDGYVQVYTGDGKGKTTAALGLCLRAVGSGLRVYLGQFLKNSKCSEIKALKSHLKSVEIHQFGSGRFVRGKPTEADIRKAATGFLQITDAVLSGKYDLVVADELNVAVALELVTPENVLELIRAKPVHVELVITGRSAHPKVMRSADLVTEMRKKKHYYDKGVHARRGIES